MLKFFIWFCLLILGCTKPSPDWKNNDANGALLSSLLDEDPNDNGDDEAPIAEKSGLKGDKKAVCSCDKLPLDTDLKKAVTKHGKGDKRCGCCCCDCCDDCCCGGGGGGGGCGCGCCDCCDCCHGDDCCCHDCCHDCCHGGDCGCGDCCCGCGCCSHDCHCHDHFHQNWVPACCCCCCNQNQNTAADKAKDKKLKEKAAAKAGVAATEDAAKADLVNATEGVGNETANTTKPADGTADLTEPSPANDTANAIKPAENNSGSGEEPADTIAAIKTAVDAIKAQTTLKRRCCCDQAKSKKCDIVKDTRCKKNTNKVDVKSHCCCGCHHHCCHPCHHTCCHDCHHHHHHHHHHCCCNNNSGSNDNCCCGNNGSNCGNNCCCGSNGSNNNCCCGSNGSDNNNCCCGSNDNCGCDDKKEDKKKD